MPPLPPKGKLYAGTAEVDLEPEPGLVTGDGAPLATGQRTPLYVRALVLANGHTQLALVTLDELGIDRPDALRAAQQVEQATGIAADAVLLACSHTHVAPSMLPTLHTYRQAFNPHWNEETARRERQWVEKVIGKVVKAVSQAQAACAPASLGVICADLPWLVFNRRRRTKDYGIWTHWMGIPSNQAYGQEGEIDPQLALLVVRDAQDEPFCLLWNFTGHNSFSFGAEYSADLAYTVQAALDERLGRHLPCFYLAGCSGNTNYHDYLQPIGLEKATEGITSAIMAIHRRACTLPEVRLGCRKMPLQFAQRDVTRNWWKADIAAKMPDWNDYAERELERFRRELQEEETYTADVQVLRLGECGLVALSAEAFVEFGLMIKEQSPFDTTLVVTYANGYAGYVATRQAFIGGSYEVWPTLNARIGREGGYWMVDKAVQLLRQLDGQGGQP